jgi:hypothetical protein
MVINPSTSNGSIETPAQKRVREGVIPFDVILYQTDTFSQKPRALEEGFGVKFGQQFGQ